MVARAGDLPPPLPLALEQPAQQDEKGRKLDKIGLRSQDTSELYFEDCRVPAENLLGQEGDGFMIAMSSLDGGRIGAMSTSGGDLALVADPTTALEREYRGPIEGGTDPVDEIPDMALTGLCEIEYGFLVR